MNFRLTKKESLAIFCCAVFMLTALGAAGAGSRERARRTVCKANLYQWYQAIKGFADDNDGTLLSSFGYQNPITGTISSPYPCELWLDAENLTGNPAYDHENILSQETIRSYLSGFNDNGYTYYDINSGNYNSEDLRFKGAWRCPSNTSNTPDLTISQIQMRGFFRMKYAYYARVDLWLDSASNPEDITAKHLGSKGVIMADPFYNWSNGTALIYNHGLFGYSDDDATQGIESLISGGWNGDGLPSITGLNRVFGDGHAEWKDRQDFNVSGNGVLVGTASSPYTEPHVEGVPGDAHFY